MPSLSTFIHVQASRPDHRDHEAALRHALADEDVKIKDLLRAVEARRTRQSAVMRAMVADGFPREAAVQLLDTAEDAPVRSVGEFRARVQVGGC